MGAPDLNVDCLISCGLLQVVQVPPLPKSSRVRQRLGLLLAVLGLILPHQTQKTWLPRFDVQTKETRTAQRRRATSTCSCLSASLASTGGAAGAAVAAAVAAALDVLIDQHPVDLRQPTPLGPFLPRTEPVAQTYKSVLTCTYTWLYPRATNPRNLSHTPCRFWDLKLKICLRRLPYPV